MNDKDNIKELIGARFEEIHLSETMAETLPSDEEILRWETLARARHAQKQRNKRRLLSLAAVFLLAIVISVAVIISPPDAEAGGDGKAVIVGNDSGLMVIEYDSIETLQEQGHNQFTVLDDDELIATSIHYTKANNTEQLEVIYESNHHGGIVLTEINNKDSSVLENLSDRFNQKEIWENKEIYIVVDPDFEEKKTYNFIYNDIFVSLYTETMIEKEVRRIIEETF